MRYDTMPYITLQAISILHRKTNQEYIKLADIYDEVEKIKQKPNSNKGSVIRRTLEEHCKECKSYTNKADLFSSKKIGSGLWKSNFFDNIKRIESLKIDQAFSLNELEKIFKIDINQEINISYYTYTLILIMQNNDNNSKIENERILYTIENQIDSSNLKNKIEYLTNSLKNDLPIYLFLKDKNTYIYKGECFLEGAPFTVTTSNKIIYKFPLNIINSKTQYIYLETLKNIQDDIDIINDKKDITFIDKPIKIKKYNKNYNENNSSANKDYISSEIVNTIQGNINEEIIFNYELNKVANLGATDKVEIMKNFFNNRKDSDGFDILSFDLDKNGKFHKKYIEVKSTKGNENTPIDITSNELEFAKSHKNNYYIYRIYNSNSNEKKCKIINGNTLFKSFKLVPTSYKIFSKDN